MYGNGVMVNCQENSQIVTISLYGNPLIQCLDMNIYIRDAQDTPTHFQRFRVSHKTQDLQFPVSRSEDAQLKLHKTLSL